MKISVILPTNKKNTAEELDKFKDLRAHILMNALYEPLTQEFAGLALGCIDGTSVLAPTLNALNNQTFDDFEVLLCHRYPEEVKWIEMLYPELDLVVIPEKHSIWHDYGEEYRTVNNIRNTGLIHTKGELILFLDDYTIFNENLLQQAWDAYQEGYYITARGMRRIRHDPKAKPIETITRKTIVDKEIYSSYNFNNLDEGDKLPNSATWTYCCTVSLEEALRINGFDELWDGNFGGTDQDFGRRLAKITKYDRKLMGTIYEFAHKSPRQKIRNDEILRQMCGQMFPKHVRANEWKPTEAEMRRYKRWHHSNIGYLNPRWNNFMDIPMYDIENIRKEYV